MTKSQRSTTRPAWIQDRYPVSRNHHRILVGVGLTAGLVAGAYLAKFVAVAVMIGMMYVACDPSKGSC